MTCLGFECHGFYFEEVNGIIYQVFVSYTQKYGTVVTYAKERACLLRD